MQMADIKKSRYSEEQLIGFLKQADAGMPITELCRHNGLSVAMPYNWHAKFGGMDLTDARQLNSARLKRISARETSSCPVMPVIRSLTFC
jgi:putative transposase